MNAWMIAGLVMWTLLLILSLFGQVKFSGVQVHNPIAKVLCGIFAGIVIILVFGFIGVIGYAMATPIAYLFGVQL
jgi:hypothetical protein